MPRALARYGAFTSDTFSSRITSRSPLRNGTVRTEGARRGGGEAPLGEAEERVVRRQRLLLEDVQRGAGHLSLPDGLDERRLADHAAPGAVDDPDAVLHLRELAGPEKIPGFGRERDMDRDEGGPLEQLVELPALGADPLGGFGRQVRIVGDDLHPEPQGAAGNLGADPPE